MSWEILALGQLETEGWAGPLSAVKVMGASTIAVPVALVILTASVNPATLVRDTVVELVVLDDHPVTLAGLVSVVLIDLGTLEKVISVGVVAFGALIIRCTGLGTSNFSNPGNYRDPRWSGWCVSFVQLWTLTPVFFPMFVALGLGTTSLFVVGLFENLCNYLCLYLSVPVFVLE
jgi:hypothetical protein